MSQLSKQPTFSSSKKLWDGSQDDTRSLKVESTKGSVRNTLLSHKFNHQRKMSIQSSVCLPVKKPLSTLSTQTLHQLCTLLALKKNQAMTLKNPALA